MKNLLLISLLISSCATVPEVAKEEPKKEEPAQVQEPVKQIPRVAISDITSIVEKNPSCTGYSFKDRGRAGIGYFKGLALVYARSVCQKDRADVKVVSSTTLGPDTSDVMAHYPLKPVDPLKQVYTLLIGLGMRESSGQYCVGRDMSANFSSANSAEAGLFQASWGASVKSTTLPEMLSSTRQCHLDIFKEKVGTCKSGDAKNWGDGQGYLYQKKAKECPAFATEYAAVLLRKHGGSKGEFGPLRRRAAEYVPACEKMLDQVKQAVLKVPELCEIL